MAETKHLSWDDPQIDPGEVITEEEIKSAEQLGSKAPVGRYLCTCVESVPKQVDFKEYSCIAAGLKFRIDKTLELGVKEDKRWEFKPVVGDQGEDFEGMFIFDDIAMASPKEKEGMKKRRILVAKRLGLISDTTAQITKQMWAKDVVGKQAIITVEENIYTDKNGNEKANTRVGFSGYDYAESAKTNITADDYDDI
jgi:hypothetical protein